jgi:hypothetical protein
MRPLGGRRHDLVDLQGPAVEDQQAPRIGCRHRRHPRQVHIPAVWRDANAVARPLLAPGWLQIGNGDRLLRLRVDDDDGVLRILGAVRGADVGEEQQIPGIHRVRRRPGGVPALDQPQPHSARRLRRPGVLLRVRGCSGGTREQDGDQHVRPSHDVSSGLHVARTFQVRAGEPERLAPQAQYQKSRWAPIFIRRPPITCTAFSHDVP